MTDQAINLFHDIRRRVRATQTSLEQYVGVAQNIDSEEQDHTELIDSQYPVMVPNDNRIYIALKDISEALGNSYVQVKLDIANDSRISWAGTAHEIRQILSSLLQLLAPDKSVKTSTWYKQEEGISGPTQKQRVRYILQNRGANSKEHEVAEQIGIIEDTVGNLVRGTYSRASDAAHTFKAKKEVIRILRYFEAFVHDLLDL